MLACCLALSAGGLAAPVAAQDGERDARCPERRHSYVRHEEDHAFLRDPSCRTGPFDALKFMPLDLSDTAYLSLGGEVRQRYERFSGFDLGGAGAYDPNGYYASRYMLAADLRAAAGWRLFGQLRYGQEEGRPGRRRPANDGAPELHELFAELPVLPGGFLRLGRQEIAQPLVTANRRLLSAREGPNLRRSWDGALASVQVLDGWQMRGFYAREVRLDRGAFDDASRNGVRFWGVRFEGRAAPGLGLDVYYYGIDEARPAEAAGAGNARHTIGARLHTTGPIAGWVIDAEGAAQFGRQAGREVRAGFAAADAEYRVMGVPLGLGLVGRAAWFSGGRSQGGDGRVFTFDPLFPAGNYLNDAEQLRGSNVITGRAGVNLRPAEGLTVRLAWDEYLRASTDDGVYGTTGAEDRRGGESGERRIGGYLGLLAAWQVTTDLDIALLAGRFFPGAFLRQTGPAREVDFLRLDVRVRL